MIANDPNAPLHETEIPLFEDLGEDGRRHLASFMQRQSFDAGERILEEGALDRDMYIILSGAVSIRREELEVGCLGPGEHFGELALVTGRPRMADAVAVTPVELARLSVDAFGSLSASDPELALGFVRILMGLLGVRFADMTENVGWLLRDRSLPRHVEVDVHIGTEKRTVKTGTRLEEVLPTEVEGHPVVAAMVNRRATSLCAPISSGCDIEPLTSAHWEGKRIYRVSLALLLLEAAHTLDPQLHVQIEHSLGVGQRVRVEGLTSEGRQDLARRLEESMRELVRGAQPLREEWWTVVEARAHFEEWGWEGASELLETWRHSAVPLSSYGHAYAPCTGPLVWNTSRLSEFKLFPDDDGLILVHGESVAPADISAMAVTEIAHSASRRAGAMTREHRRWLTTLGMTSVGEFNRACVHGEVSQVIRVAEGFQEKRSSQIADEIHDRLDDVRVVCIAGPSSSGKSTFIKRLKVQLQVNGIHPVEISLDNYYCDRSRTPRDEKGDYDYETIDALRRDLLRDHVLRLLAGETVTTARYDFGPGISLEEGGPTIRLGKDDILLVEGIHGLNPDLIGKTPDDKLFRIFICPLAQLPFDRLARLHASDVRLLRRIVRDRHSRGATAAQNIARWPSVRRGERTHIFPFQDHADAIFDSSLIYEISVLKVFAERYLLEVPQDSPEYTTAFRLLALCDRFVTIYPDHVPPTSILREFIGGSGFEF